MNNFPLKDTAGSEALAKEILDTGLFREVSSWSPDERRFIAKSNDAYRIGLSRWTRKALFYKAIGKNLEAFGPITPNPWEDFYEQLSAEEQEKYIYHLDLFKEIKAG